MYFEVCTEHDDIIVVSSDNFSKEESCREYVTYKFGPQYGYKSVPKFTVRRISKERADELVSYYNAISWC